MDSGVESAIQLLNETMCIAKSGVTEWAVDVCRNGGGTAYTEIDAESVYYKANLCAKERALGCVISLPWSEGIRRQDSRNLGPTLLPAPVQNQNCS